MIRGGALLFAGLASAACAAPFRGGHAEPEGPLSGSKTLSRFVPGHCEDSAHAPHTPRFSAVEVIETATGRTVLAEHRQGYERLVVENFHDEGPFWVFEVIVSGDELRRYRVPRGSGGVGLLEVGRELTETPRGDGFEAGLAASRLRCTLVPKEASLPPEAKPPDGTDGGTAP